MEDTEVNDRFDMDSSQFCQNVKLRAARIAFVAPQLAVACVQGFLAVTQFEFTRSQFNLAAMQLAVVCVQGFLAVMQFGFTGSQFNLAATHFVLTAV